MTNARVMQVATSLNSALANYYKKSEVYNKTEIDSKNTWVLYETVTGNTQITVPNCNEFILVAIGDRCVSSIHLNTSMLEQINGLKMYGGGGRSGDWDSLLVMFMYIDGKVSCISFHHDNSSKNYTLSLYYR